MNSNSNNPIPNEYRTKQPKVNDLLENAMNDIIRNKKNKRHLLFNFCRNVLTSASCVCDSGQTFYEIFSHNYLSLNPDFENLRDINIMLNCLRIFNPPVKFVSSRTGTYSSKIYLHSVVEEYCVELLNFIRLCNSNDELKEDSIDIFDLKITLLIKLFNQVVFEKASINNGLGKIFNFITDPSNSFEKLSDNLSSALLEEIVFEFCKKEGVKVCCSIHSPKSGDILLNMPPTNSKFKVLEVKSTNDSDSAKKNFTSSINKIPDCADLYFGVFGGNTQPSKRGEILVSLNIMSSTKAAKEKSRNMFSFFKKLDIAYKFAFSKAEINNSKLNSSNCDNINSVLTPNLQAILQINNTGDYVIFDTLHPVVSIYKKPVLTGYIKNIINRPTNDFGFIISDTGGYDVFFNSTPYLQKQYNKHYKNGLRCRVSYTELPSTGYKKKPKAKNIKVINPIIKGIRKETKNKRDKKIKKSKKKKHSKK